MSAVFADQACTTNIIPTNLISHACMLQKGCYSAKTFLTVNPRRFIPSKYTHCTIQYLSKWVDNIKTNLKMNITIIKVTLFNDYEARGHFFWRTKSYVEDLVSLI